MTMTPEQIDALCELYATQIVDNMDLKTMEQFVYDTIIENVSYKGENEILEEISNYFDEDDLAKMITQVGANPETVLN